MEEIDGNICLKKINRNLKKERKLLQRKKDEVIKILFLAVFSTKDEFRTLMFGDTNEKRKFYFSTLMLETNMWILIK